MNLNSLLKSADDQANKPKGKPSSVFSKPTMNKLAGFE